MEVRGEYKTAINIIYRWEKKIIEAEKSFTYRHLISDPIRSDQQI